MNAALHSDTSALSGKFLVFSINGTAYGLEIAHVTEIIGIQDITCVPHSPDYVRGITNIRGAVVPVLDLRLRFGLPEAEYGERTCIVLAGSEALQVGLIVDAVEDVADLSPENILPLPQGGFAEKNKFLKAIGKSGESIWQIIDLEKVLKTDLVPAV